MTTWDGEARDELLGLAAAAGFDVSATQLARWHRAGLLPQPKQRSLGRGRGTETIYPPGTGDQLLALCEQLRRDRRLTVATWALWWAGFPVPMTAVRRVLNEAAARFDVASTQLGSLIDHPRARRSITDVADEMALGRTDAKSLRQARKRTGRSAYSTVARVVLEIAAGRFTGFEMDVAGDATNSDAKVVERGLGLERARSDALADAEPWLSGPLDESLADVSDLVRAHPFAEVVAGADDAELVIRRDELRLLLALIGDAGEAFDDTFGRDAFGFGSVARMSAAMRPTDRIGLFVGWVLFRRYGDDRVETGYAAMARAAESWERDAVPAQRALEALRQEVPGFAELASPSRARRALRSRSRQEQWFADVRAFRASHAAELDAYFASHPEFANLNESSVDE